MSASWPRFDLFRFCVDTFAFISHGPSDAPKLEALSRFCQPWPALSIPLSTEVSFRSLICVVDLSETRPVSVISLSLSLKRNFEP